MRNEVRRERDAIAALRAEWARLENPARLEVLARRHLGLRPAELSQFDSFDNLPERPKDIVPPNEESLTAKSDGADQDLMTGSIPAAPNGASAR
jgi:hypothetical protein